MPNLEEFRQQTRAWLEENCPASMREPIKSDKDQCWGGRNRVFASDDQRVWLERMAERGWTAPQWPQEYGGGAISLMIQSPCSRLVHAVVSPPYRDLEPVRNV